MSYIFLVRLFRGNWQTRFWMGIIILLATGITIGVFWLTKFFIKYYFAPEEILSKQTRRIVVVVQSVFSMILGMILVNNFLDVIEPFKSWLAIDELFRPVLMLGIFIFLTILMGIFIELFLVCFSVRYRNYRIPNRTL
jgi:hypothetical protein